MVARTRVNLTLYVHCLSCWRLNLMIDVVSLRPWKFDARRSSKFRFQIFLLSGYARREMAKDAGCINDHPIFNTLKTIFEDMYCQVKHSAVYLWLWHDPHSNCHCSSTYGSPVCLCNRRKPYRLRDTKWTFTYITYSFYSSRTLYTLS